MHTNTSNLAQIAIDSRVKIIERVQVDLPPMCPLDTDSTGTMIQGRTLSPEMVPEISPEKRITITATD